MIKCLLIIYHVKNVTILTYGTHAISVENAEGNFKTGILLNGMDYPGYDPETESEEE